MASKESAVSFQEIKGGFNQGPIKTSPRVRKKMNRFG